MAKSFIDSLRKRIGSSSFTESKFSEPTHYIDTGYYSINRVITGHPKLGIPGGRTIILSGESQSGKTFLAMNTAANAIKQNKYSHVIYFDSEGGAPKDMIENLGVDPDLLEHAPVESCEDATAQILRTYEAIKDAQKDDPNLRVLLILDSLGMLVPSKIFTDATENNDQKFDQGARARLIRGLVTASTIPAMKTDCGIIFLNHMYSGPEQHPSKIKNQSGGMAPIYAATVALQCSKLLVKPEDKKGSETFYDGSLLRIFSIKNRIARPFFEGAVNIDFKRGITNKYEGLWDAAVKYGFIEMSGAWCKIPSWSEKKVYPSQVEASDEVWNTFFDKFCEKSVEDMKYSKISEVPEIAAMENAQPSEEETQEDSDKEKDK